MPESSDTAMSVECPCCGATLRIDPELGRVIAHTAPTVPRRSSGVPLERATEILEQQAARRDAIFRRSSEDEKVKSALLDRKFAEALRTTRDQPIERPTRDFDLE